MGQFCFARWRLLSVVVVCRLSSLVTLPAGGWAGRRARGQLAAAGPGAWAFGRPTLHGEPVRLRPVMATPCYWLVTVAGVCRRLSSVRSVTLSGRPATLRAQARRWRHATSSLIIAPRLHAGPVLLRLVRATPCYPTCRHVLYCTHRDAQKIGLQHLRTEIDVVLYDQSLHNTTRCDELRFFDRIAVTFFLELGCSTCAAHWLAFSFLCTVVAPKQCDRGIVTLAASI